MTNVTIVIPVKNESINLGKCISLLNNLGPVVVVDSSSIDDTQKVAKGMGADLLNFNWNGKFPKKRNWTLRTYDFKTEWVLFLDADEFVTPEFIEEVKTSIESNQYQGYWLNFSNYFMGKALKGGDSFRKLALFRIDSGEYEKIEEDSWSHLDMEVHEHPVLRGKIGEIVSPIEHNDFRGLKHYIAKHNEYSTWEVLRYERLIGKHAAEWVGLTNRQKMKYRNLAKWWFAPVYFIVSYFLKKGFLDGAVGFHFTLMKAIYFYQIRLKIKERRGINCQN